MHVSNDLLFADDRNFSEFTLHSEYNERGNIAEFSSTIVFDEPYTLHVEAKMNLFTPTCFVKLIRFFVANSLICFAAKGIFLHNGSPTIAAR